MESEEEKSLNEVVDFLKKRKASDTTIENIKKQKIDVTAISHLTEKDFDGLGVTLGDRRALQSTFASTGQNPGAIKKLKDFLKAKNQQRMKKQTKSAHTKSTLKLEIGWRHKDSTSKDYRQVKFPQGGGTRLKDFDRNATYETVLNASKDLFFPNGVNKRKGFSLEGLGIFLGNYSGNCVKFIDGVEFNVDRYRKNASVSKGNVPRVYLMSSVDKQPDDNEKEAEIEEENETKEILDDFGQEAFAEFNGDITLDEIFESSSVLELEGTCSWTLQAERELIEQQNEEFRVALEADQRKEEEREIARRNENLREEREAKVPNEPQIEEEHVLACVRHLNLGVVTRGFPSDCQMDAVYNWIGSLRADPPHFALFAMVGMHMKTLVYPSESILPQTMLYMEERDGPIPPALPSLNNQAERSTEVLIDENSPLEESTTHNEAERVGKRTVILTVHRSTILADIIKQFIQIRILNDPAVEMSFKVVNNRGETELGAGVGVSRDVIAMFWEKFFDSLTVGTKVRIPTIRHCYEAKEWDAIALFLLKGFTQCNYFPLALSPVYVKLVLSGEESVTKEELLEELLKFVAKDEADVVRECLSGNLECDSEEILEFLSAYDVRQLPNQSNVKEIFTKLAHKEIVQKPHYITERWSAILRPLQANLTNGINSVYEKLQPTTKIVLKMLKCEPANDNERLVFGYLKRFIKGLESNQLTRFLTFTTGCDLMVCDCLSINFLQVDGLARRPIAHTCGPCLELPTTYQSFPELREKFSSILALSTWEMDIV